METHGWTVDIKDLALTGIRPIAEEIEFKARIRLTRRFKEGPAVDITPFAMSYSASERTLISLGTGTHPAATFYKALSFKPETLALLTDDAVQRVDYGFLFPRADGSLAYMPMLLLSDELNERVQGFWRATRGLPTSVSGGFLRMLYFSAMTITTVGFGDIVPITTTARLLVASEAILGIVVIGLFLNSLVQSWQKLR